jgi:alpha-methylacyl-CoA racemase
MRKPTTGPLQGIRILDLTRLLPGPLGTMLMADMGAEVIKIEDPNQPDYVRIYGPHLNGESINYLSYNRSKRSMWLSLTTDEGRATFFRLVETADVVVEQFRPGFLDKLGVGYAAARAVNPRIIYVSVTGYGQTGPYAHLAGHDLNYLAISGVLSATGDAETGPVMPGVQMADIAGGSYMTVIATQAALLARHRTGLGQHVDVAMTDGAMPLLTAMYALFAGGAVAQAQRGLAPLSGGLVNYQVYETQDGKYIALGTLEPKFWAKFCQLVERPDWLEFFPPRNAAHLAEGKAALSALFQTKSQSGWVQLGLANDLLISPVNDLADLENDPQLLARQMILTETHPVAGTYKTIGVPLQFSETPAQPAWPAPIAGADTADILAELGL